MSIKSVKFGGTSMGDANSIMECADIIKQRLNSGDKLIVTVSAIKGVTDNLIKLIDLARNSKSGLVEKSVSELSKLHKDILFKIVNTDAEKIWIEKFLPLIKKLYAISHGISLVEDLTDKTVAKVCAFGEKLSSLLMIEALKILKIPAERIESERIINTDDSYLKAKVNFSKTNISAKKVLKPILNKSITPIITGFIGKDVHGNITLLGRGGSDYTASIIAMIFNAISIEIWTDVDGIMTADPKIVNDAFSLESIEMNIMSEMVYSGAKVIHPDTIALAIENDIPVYVYNTFNRNFSGTKITKLAPKAKGLVGTKDNTLITLENNNIINRIGFLKKISSLIADLNISIDVCATSEISFTFSIKSENYSEKLYKMLQNYGKVIVKHNITKICFIGNEIAHCTKLLSDIFNACNQNNIPVYTTIITASANNITIMIDSYYANKALEILHKNFFSKCTNF